MHGKQVMRAALAYGGAASQKHAPLAVIFLSEELPCQTIREHQFAASRVKS